MNEAAELSQQQFVGGLIVLGSMAASVAVWTWIAARRGQGLPVLPYQPRRYVPWGGAHVAAVVIVYFVLGNAAGLVIGYVLGPDLTRLEKVEEAANEHFIQGLAEGGAGAFALAVILAAIVAPVFEEFLFRVILQGWLEKVERRWRRFPAVRKIVPRALLPVLLSALSFAAMHFRVARDEVPQYQYLVALAVGTIAVSVLTMLFALVLLRFSTRATAADLGWAPQRILPDLGLGVLAFLAVAGPLYLVLIASNLWLTPLGIAADPLPIFVLALGLGVVYYRTHRLMPVIAMHMTLNTITLALLAAGAAK